ncbi:hypothetical protein ACFL6U_12805 [Planctomycetota bacterium]
MKKKETICNPKLSVSEATDWFVSETIKQLDIIEEMTERYTLFGKRGVQQDYSDIGKGIVDLIHSEVICKYKIDPYGDLTPTPREDLPPHILQTRDLLRKILTHWYRIYKDDKRDITGKHLHRLVSKARDLLLDSRGQSCKSKKSKTALNMSGEARALAVLTDHPDWTNKEIAKKAGVHEKTLSRYQNFCSARKMMKESGIRDIPRGHKTEEGDLEAYNEG